MKTCHWLALGCVVVAAGAWWWYNKNKKQAPAPAPSVTVGNTGDTTIKSQGGAVKNLSGDFGDTAMGSGNYVKRQPRQQR